MKNDSELSLILEGTLGSCWYGNYNYLEPWVGCAHNCLYCYSKSRNIVKNMLEKVRTTFECPATFISSDKLLKEISEEIEEKNIQILKLCRYTDFFNKKFVDNNLAYEILDVLCKSEVRRIIITTKNIPDSKIIKLMTKYKNKFSYNSVIKPECENVLEPFCIENKFKMQIASEIRRSGILTTVHMDPLVLSIFEEPTMWDGFLDQLKTHGLDRIMFSYLFLDEEIKENIKKSIDSITASKLVEEFDQKNIYEDRDPHIDRGLYYLKKPVRKKHAEMLATILKKKGFSFVLCTLKSADDDIKIDKENCPHCNGVFYA